MYTRILTIYSDAVVGAGLPALETIENETNMKGRYVQRGFAPPSSLESSEAYQPPGWEDSGCFCMARSGANSYSGCRSAIKIVRSSVGCVP